MTPIAPHITAFFTGTAAPPAGRQRHTCESYAYTFQLLLTFCGPTSSTSGLPPFASSTSMHLGHAFLAHLEAERGNSPSTRNTRLAAIKSFWRFLEYRVPPSWRHSRRVLAIPTKKTDVPLVTHLSMPRCTRFSRPRTVQTPRGYTRSRDAASGLCRRAAGVGARHAPRTAVTFSPTPAVQVRGKGRRERALPLWKQTAEDLRAWFAVRGDLAVQNSS